MGDVKIGVRGALAEMFEAWDERHRKNTTLFRTWIGPYAEINLKEPEQVEVRLAATLQRRWVI